MFRPVEQDVSFPKLEEKILAFWDERDVFGESLRIRENAPTFVFYDGPPFATGLPHYGHLLAGILKDIVPRYWTMRGYHVPRRFGWDCHGLPVENEVEKELGFSGRRDIVEYGIGAFNEKCRSIVLRYTAEWRSTVRRKGRWVDFDDDYKTMQPEFMESVWWVFHRLWEKDLIYRGHSVQPYCPRCATPLSNFEANMDYRDVQDPSVTIRLPIDGQPGTHFLVWTTTPWTLPENLGLAVGGDIDYVKIKDGDAAYWLAESRVAAYYPKADDVEVLERAKGAALAGLRYAPPFDYFRSVSSDTFVAVTADFVSTEDGTGIVHMAPAFGEDDQAIGKREGWPTVLPLDADCRFTSEVPDFEGLQVKEADPLIIRALDEKGILFRRATIDHSYPHCWRCESPLIYRAIPSWFCKIEPIKPRMIELNRSINWVPDHLRTGRFGSWIENARDWNLSRNRFWGAPIPVWMSEDGSERVCISSREELEKRSGTKVDDLHKHFVDDVTIPSADGKTQLRRVPEVFDCWFESGSMPYAQHHYPFENKEMVERGHPADFIAEGIDQTRGWFYTLLILSTAVFDDTPFKNVIVNGMLLAEDGKKMSKRDKNYPDPVYVLDTYGADALRAYLINSPAVKAEDLRFTERGLVEIIRRVILPLWNGYSFFVTYARIDGWTPRTPRVEATHRLDRWILSNLQTLVRDVNAHMDRYELYRVVPRLDGFIDDLTNWYIRRSRERFWGNDDATDKTSGYQTLYDVLVSFAKVLAPVLPFVCDEIYRNLVTTFDDDAPISVHLCDYPMADESLRDETLEEEMRLARRIVGLGRALRAKHKVKTRQPLAEVTVVARTDAERSLISEMEDIILDELNVKRLTFTEREEELVEIGAKANFRTLGPRFGPEMRNAARVIETLDLEAIRLLEGGTTVDVLGEEITIDDILVSRTEREGHVTETGDGVTVSLDLDLTPELISEGLARELKNRIQSLRKETGLDVSDRINVHVHAPDALREGFEKHEAYVKGETLAEVIRFSPPLEGTGETKACDIDGETFHIEITPVG